MSTPHITQYSCQCAHLKWTRTFTVCASCQSCQAVRLQSVVSSANASWCSIVHKDGQVVSRLGLRWMRLSTVWLAAKRAARSSTSSTLLISSCMYVLLLRLPVVFKKPADLHCHTVSFLYCGSNCYRTSIASCMTTLVVDCVFGCCLMLPDIASLKEGVCIDLISTQTVIKPQNREARTNKCGSM